MRVLGAAAAAVMLLLLLSTPRGVFSGDEGVKLIQVQSVAAHRFTSDTLIYPGSRFDRAGGHFPLQTPHIVGERWRWHSIYSPIFAAICVPGWWLGGYLGALVVPALGAVLSALLAAHLVRRCGRGPLAAGLTGMAVLVLAPVAVYGVTLTEHTLAVAIVLATVILLDRDAPRPGQLVLCGALLGLGAILRTELVMWSVGLGVFALCRWGLGLALARRMALVGAAAALVFGAYALRNQLLLGTWNPAVLANDLDNLRTALDQGLPMLVPLGAPDLFGWPPWKILVAALAVGALAWLPGQARLGWALAAAVTAFLWGWVCVRGMRDVLDGHQRGLSGLLVATPLALVGVMTVGRAPRRTEHAAALAGIVYAVLVFWTNLDKLAGGLQIGARHLLPAAPLLLLPLASLIEASRRFWLLVAPLLALSLLASVVQVVALARVKAYHHGLAAGVYAKGLPDIVTSFFWTAQILAEGYPDHRITIGTDSLMLDEMRARHIDLVVETLTIFSESDNERLGLELVDGSDPQARIYRILP